VRRLWIAPAVALALFGVSSAPALAAGTMNFTTYASFDAATGVENRVTVHTTLTDTTEDLFRITDTADVIVVTPANPACAGSGTNTVTCTGEIDFGHFIDLGDLADEANLTGNGLTYLSGDEGNDTLMGSPDPDSEQALTGREGDDRLFGREGSDFLEGGAGTDFLEGGPGNDSAGEEGGDGEDTIDLGPGLDSAVYESLAVPPEGWSFDLIAGTAMRTSPGPESDILRGAEDLSVGGDSDSGDDTVSGTEGANEISTGEGNDLIRPLGGFDTVFAEEGNDNIEAADGIGDRVDCGQGSDSLLADQLDVPVDCETVNVVQTRPAGADLVPPECALEAARGAIGRRAFVRGLLATVTCNEPVTASLRLVVRVRRLRGGRFVTARAGDLVLAETSTAGGRRVRLRPARRLVRRLPLRFKATLLMSARDEYGNRDAITRTLRVRAPRKRKRSGR
jgi:RTX calcium-binding nonapeptide repeat (4 copies)